MMSLSFFMSSGVAVCNDFGCGRDAAEEEAEVAMLRQRGEQHNNAARKQGVSSQGTGRRDSKRSKAREWRQQQLQQQQ